MSTLILIQSISNIPFFLLPSPLSLFYSQIHPHLLLSCPPFHMLLCQAISLSVSLPSLLFYLHPLQVFTVNQVQAVDLYSLGASSTFAPSVWDPPLLYSSISSVSTTSELHPACPLLTSIHIPELSFTSLPSPQGYIYNGSNDTVEPSPQGFYLLQPKRMCYILQFYSHIRLYVVMYHEFLSSLWILFKGYMPRMSLMYSEFSIWIAHAHCQEMTKVSEVCVLRLFLQCGFMWKHDFHICLIHLYNKEYRMT